VIASIAIAPAAHSPAAHVLPRLIHVIAHSSFPARSAGLWCSLFPPVAAGVHFGGVAGQHIPGRRNRADRWQAVIRANGQSSASHWRQAAMRASNQDGRSTLLTPGCTRGGKDARAAAAAFGE